MYNEKEFVDDEYITDENDPTRVEKITEEDYTIPEKEEKIKFDEILASPKSSSSFELSRHDYLQNKKVLDALRKGDFRK